MRRFPSALRARRRGFALAGALLVLAAVALLVVAVLRWQSLQRSDDTLQWQQELARRQALTGLAQARMQAEALMAADARFTHLAVSAEGRETLMVWGEEDQPLALLGVDAPDTALATLAHGLAAPLVELRTPDGQLAGRYAYAVADEGMRAHRTYAPGAAAVEQRGTTAWSRGVQSAPDGSGLRVNWSLQSAAEAQAAAFMTDAPLYWDAEQRELKASHGVAAPRPRLTEAAVEAGVYVFGAPNVRNRYSLNLRYHVQAELWNPYPWPLAFPASTFMGYEQAARLVWKDLPAVRVTSYRRNGSGWSVRDQTPWLPLDELLREGEPRERNLVSWLDVAGWRLEPGEVYRSLEPDLARQPEGLARRLSNEFYVDVQFDRLEVEFSDALYSLHLIPFAHGFAENGYEVDNAYASQGGIPLAAQRWVFEPPLAVAQGGNPAVYVVNSDTYRPANRYWGAHWQWSERPLVTGVASLDQGGGEGRPIDPTRPLSASNWAGGYFQSPNWRTHEPTATRATWLDWPRAPVHSWSALRNAPGLEGLGWPGGPNAWLDSAFFAGDQASLVPWPEGTVLPEPTDPAAAAQVLREGTFNLNSPHYAAWRAWLELAFERLPQSTLPLYAPAAGEAVDEAGLARAASQARGRELSPAQLDQLAARLAEGNRQRSEPWRSVAELADSAWLQQALEAVGPALTTRDGTFPTVEPLYPDAERLDGLPALALPGVIDQADLLLALGPWLAVRSDTFRIVFYGEAVHPRSGEVTARAWGEAILQRTPELRADGEGRTWVQRGLRWLTPPD
ncbi:MAG: hypothetical protein Q7P63_02755 [Verrucomicrobiota bacterium JB022]|nr:hypothetical protein [Verrucomicrobiota bacterium JB022]